MMNVLEQEDIIKGLPDQALMQEAQMPSGQVPQYLVVSEIQRRSDMRKRYKADQGQMPQGTVKDKVVQEGIMASMPPQMSPQMAMAPQMPQRMPQMPPPQMPPQGIEQAMPPQMMAEGGIVKMAPGGSMPGAGALYGMQKEYVDPLIERAKVLAEMGVASFEDALAQLQREAQINNPDYSMVGRGDLFPNMSELRQGLSDLGGQFQDAGQRGADAMRGAFDAIPKYSTGDPLQGARDFAGNFAFDSAMNMPNYQLLGRNDLSLPSIPELSTAPQRGAGGRPFDLGGFGDVASGIASGVAEYNQAKRDSLSPSITSQDIDDAVSGVVTERAGGSEPPFGPPASEIYKDSFVTKGFDALKDGYGYLVGLDQRLAGAANRGIDSFLGSFSNPFGSSDAVEYAQPPMVQTEEEMASEAAYNNLIEAQMDAIDEGRPGPVIARDKNVQTRGEEKQGGGSKKEPLLEEITVDRERKDLSGILSGLVGTPSQDRSNKANDPTLDFSDLIADSRRQAMSNALIQLGAGIAGGDVSKGIAAAGQAATEGTQAARDLDMNRRLAQFKAGREDLRRQDEADRFAQELGLSRAKLTQDQLQFVDRLEVMREDIRAKLDISQNANNREILDFIKDRLKTEINPAERQELIRQQNIMASLMSGDFAELLAESGDTGAGGDRQGSISDFGA
jgi:hypothetical protein